MESRITNIIQHLYHTSIKKHKILVIDTRMAYGSQHIYIDDTKAWGTNDLIQVVVCEIEGHA